MVVTAITRRRNAILTGETAVEGRSRKPAAVLETQKRRIGVAITAFTRKPPEVLEHLRTRERLGALVDQLEHAFDSRILLPAQGQVLQKRVSPMRLLAGALGDGFRRLRIARADVEK